MTNTQEENNTIENVSLHDYLKIYQSGMKSVIAALRMGEVELQKIMDTDTELPFETRIDSMETEGRAWAKAAGDAIRSLNGKLRRGAVNRGVDNRQFHPARVKQQEPQRPSHPEMTLDQMKALKVQLDKALKGK